MTQAIYSDNMQAQEFTYIKSLVFYLKGEEGLIKKVIYKLDNETYYYMEFCEVNKNYFLSDFPRQISVKDVVRLAQNENIIYKNISIEELLSDN